MDWWDFIRKYQTSLPQFDPKLDRDTGYAGVPPVQQVSAQPKEYTKDYLQGEYPDEFWSIVGNDPEETKGHGGSRHRVDKDGNYVMVGVRGDSPVGGLPKRGPYRPRKGRKNYPQDYGVRVTQKKDMPSRRNIVVKPMNVKKEAKSPAAIEHKRKYETEYESTPARKKYRRELERERRKRGVAGKGGKDMSHTKTGKIVPEDPHTNRARSHPSVGSTLKMVIVKAPLTDAPLQPGQARVDERFTLPGLKDFVNVPPGQAFASSDRQARGIALPRRGIHQMMAQMTGEGYGPHWALPGFEHIANRGEGKGREYLEEMVRELKEKDNMPVRIYAAQPHTLPFWDKMFGEGVVDSVHHTHDPNIYRPPELHFPGHPNYERHKDVPKPNWLLDKLKEYKDAKPAESVFDWNTFFANNAKREKENAESAESERLREIKEAHNKIKREKPTKIKVRKPPQKRDYMAERAKIIEERKKSQLKKEQKKLFVEGQKTLDGQPAFAPTDFVAEQQRRAKAQAEEEAKIARKRAMILQAKRAGMTTPLHEFQQNPE